MKASLSMSCFLLSLFCACLGQPEFITICYQAKMRSPNVMGREDLQDVLPSGCWSREFGYVYCVGKNVNSIPPNLPRTTTCLVIQNSEVTRLDASSINYLPNLQVLALFDNPILEVTGTFDHPSLEVLALNGGNLTSVPSISNGKIRTLELTNNQIPTMDLSAVKSSPLQALNMSGNPLSAIDATQLASFSDTLVDLNLQHTRVEAIDTATFPQLPHLRRLYVSAYNIKADAFKNVANNLQYIIVQPCTIESYGMRGIKVEYLKLGYQITCKPPSPNVLTLQSNAFNGMLNLQRLDLDYTNIQYIQEGAFAGLPALSGYLHIEFNHIRQVGYGAFNGLGKLQELRLTNNYIPTDSYVGLYDTAFSEAKLEALTMLDLSDFRMFNVSSHTFQNLPNLMYLFLGYNKIATLSEAVLTPVLPKLQRITLNANPWLCDCNLKWLRELVDKRADIFDPSTFYLWTCAGPPSLKGKVFTDLKPSQFIC